MATTKNHEAVAAVKLTVLIPARNEADNIGCLLHDILQQEDFNAADEVIVIDDHSTDSTARIVAAQEDTRIRLLQLADHLDEQQVIAHKKAAISLGVNYATHDWIVITDADCHWPKTVIGAIKAQLLDESTDLVCGPVLIASRNNFLIGFQSLDLLAYVFLTAAYTFSGQPILANGAHLTFSKALFKKIGGYSGIDHMPSGDDVLLLQKILRQQPTAKVRYLNTPESTVYTKAVSNWTAFWQQRLRWAGKTGHYDAPALDFAQGLSFVLALYLIIGSIAAILFVELRWSVLAVWLLKATIDFYVLFHLSRFYQQKSVLRHYPLAVLFQPFYLVVVGTATLLDIKVSWKGR